LVMLKRPETIVLCDIGSVVLSGLGSRRTHPVGVEGATMARRVTFPPSSIPAYIAQSMKLIVCLAQRSRYTYQKPENKEKHNETVKKYFEANKEKINQYIKEKREGNRIKSVVSKLESIDMEALAKTLIEARKIKLLEIQEQNYF
jgi:hypothetical protein